MNPALQEPELNREQGTRAKLLTAALPLFAARGVHGVSVRDIANAAGVNSALIGYYFGNKLGLLSELYREHCEPMNAERIRLLAAAQRRSETLELEKILEAFIRPALALTTNREGHSDFTRMRALLSAEDSVLLEQLVAENFDRSSSIFIDALCAALPKLKRDDVLWRFHFLLGAIYYTASGPRRIASYSEGRCNPLDVEATMQQIVPFLAAGFRAPAPRNRKRP